MYTRSYDIGPVTVFEMEGDLNLHSLRWLEESLGDFVANGRLRIVLSLGSVALITSSGLSSLIQFSQDFKQREGQIALAEVPQTGRKVLAITRLDSLFSIYDSTAAAAQALAAGDSQSA